MQNLTRTRKWGKYSTPCVYVCVRERGGEGGREEEREREGGGRERRGRERETDRLTNRDTERQRKQRIKAI